MPAKPFWIKSTTPWTTSKRSVQPNGDVSWFALSKTFGAENDPNGEFIQVLATENTSIMQRIGFIDIASGGKTISVSVMQGSGEGEDLELVNDGYDLTNNDFDLINTV